MTQQNPYQYIQDQSMKNAAFRQELLKNPRAVLERELNVVIPSNVNIRVHEDTSTDIHVVLPPQPVAEGIRQLSDEELAEAAGGMNCVSIHSGGSGGTLCLYTIYC